MANQPKLVSILQSLNVIPWEQDPSSRRFTFVGTAVVDILGFPMERWLDEEDFLFRQIPEESRTAAENAFQQALRLRHNHEVEFPVRAASGQLRRIRTLMQAVPSIAGAAATLRGVMIDVTDAPSSANVPLESAGEENYRRLLWDAPLMYLATKDIDGWPVIEDCNAAFVEALGYTREEILGRPVSDFYTRSSVAALRRLYPDPSLRGGISKAERELVTKDGRLLTVLLHAVSETAGEQGCRVNQVIYVDITPLKQAQLQLKTLSDIVEQAENIVILTDHAGSIQYVNPAFEQTTGYTSAEVIGKSPRILKSGHHPDVFYRTLWETISAGQAFKSVFQNRRKDGSEFWEDTIIFPIQDEAGGITGFASIGRDITAQKQTEAERAALTEQLRQAQKMEAVGRLAGGVAHDFNNMLTVMRGHAQLLAAQLPAGTPVYERTMDILAAADRASNLATQLLAFSKRQVIEEKALDLDYIVEQMHQMLDRLIGGGIRFIWKPSGSRCSIWADKAQVEQIVLNLVLNARDAVRRGGHILVETGLEAVGESGISMHPPLKPGEYACLTVTDDGCGIDPQVLPRIFEPFFTSKPKGYGIGLATVHSIVQQAGGSVDVVSSPGSGAKFRVYWPRFDGSRQHASARPARDSRALSGTERILLVEDEDQVRSLVRDILTSNGYQVVDMKYSQEAHAYAQDGTHGIDLLISDVALPHMSGPDLVRRIHQVRPGLAALFISGYSADPKKVPQGCGYLEKPFTPTSLLETVRELMDRGRLTRILLLESGSGDDNRVQTHLRSPLCVVEEARDVDEALSTLGKRTYDALIVTEQSKLQEIEQLHRAHPGVKMIVMAKELTAMHEQTLKSLGANAVLPVPFQPEDLRKTVRTVLLQSPD